MKLGIGAADRRTGRRGGSNASPTHAHGRFQGELSCLGRIPLLVIDEAGYIPLEAEAANLFFQLVNSRRPPSPST